MEHRISGCTKAIEMLPEDGGPVLTALRVSLETSDYLDPSVHGKIQALFDAAFDGMERLLDQ